MEDHNIYRQEKYPFIIFNTKKNKKISKFKKVCTVY